MDLSALSTGNLLAGLLFGLIGIYAFRLAKREANLMALVFSIALMGYSWFVTNVWANWAVGAVLTVFTVQSLRNS